VTINKNEEESIYEGPNLIESKYAYYYESQPRKADKSLPFLKRFPESIKCTFLDFKDFLTDIVFLKTDKVIFKNVKFI